MNADRDPSDEPELTRIIDPEDGAVWAVDLDFLGSRWTCIWDRGCRGIEDIAAPEAGLGCCSVGAELLDGEEAMTVVALAATLDPGRFQHHRAAEAGVLDADRTGTRVLDGACIFLNRPGFAGGAGCALHLGAIDDGEDPMDWKPSVCWQLPLKVVREVDADGKPVSVLRRWRRSDWGHDGDTMAWCCTEEPEPLVGDEPVVVSMGAELSALVGDEIAVVVRRRLSDRAG